MLRARRARKPRHRARSAAARGGREEPGDLVRGAGRAGGAVVRLGLLGRLRALGLTAAGDVRAGRAGAVRAGPVVGPAGALGRVTGRLLLGRPGRRRAVGRADVLAVAAAMAVRARAVAGRRDALLVG